MSQTYSFDPTADAATARGSIPGYALGRPDLARSPVSLQDFEYLKQTVLFGDDDVKYLRQAGEILVPQAEQILDVWYGFVGSHPFLAHYFVDKTTGALDMSYLTRVRGRFARWIKDTTDGQYDQAWLDYQHEIGLRHTKAGKNKADQVHASSQVDFRYMTAFIVPITATIEPFLGNAGRSPDEIRAMMAAWFKAVTLTVILWSYPYVKDGEF